jgi:hypothetical protein
MTLKNIKNESLIFFYQHLMEKKEFWKHMDGMLNTLHKMVMKKKIHICESKHNSLSQNLGLVYIVYYNSLIILHYIICRGWLKSHYLHCFET